MRAADPLSSCNPNARTFHSLGLPVSQIHKQQVLQRTAELIGQRELAARLGIQETLLDSWIRGDVTMPDGKLLVLAAILDQVAKIK